MSNDLPTLEGVKIAYVDFYYDGPISGLCWYKDKLCSFITDLDKEDYVICELKGGMLIRALAIQKMFEYTVGYHCTYTPDSSSIGPFKESISFYSDSSKACQDIEALIPGLPPENKDEEVAIGICKSIF